MDFITAENKPTLAGKILLETKPEFEKPTLIFLVLLRSGQIHAFPTDDGDSDLALLISRVFSLVDPILSDG